MSTLPQKAPRSLSQAYQLLALVALSGELPASQLSRLAGGTSYKENVVKSLKRQRLLLSYYKNGLRGYRLTAAAKKLLLEPLVVELSAEEKTALLSNLELLESAGLEIDDFGGNSVFLRSVPADVEQGSAEDLLVELADKLSKGSRDALSEKTEWVLHSISCRAAIKAGDKTSPQELMALAEKILSGEVPPFCPHGRPCVLKLTRKELEKQFGRIV